MSVALVTGAAGSLGSQLVARLLASGWTVRALDDLSTGRAAKLADVRARIDFREGDVRDAAVLSERAAGVDTIFHLAERCSEQEGFDDPVGSHSVNAEGTLVVLEAARAAGVRRVVHASSFRVYGEQGGPLVESLPPAPASPYAVQKLCGEVYVRLYHRLHGLETVSLRYFPAFGPPSPLARAEAARATELAAAAERVAGEVVNVAGPGPADPSRAKAWLGFEARGAEEETE